MNAAWCRRVRLTRWVTLAALGVAYGCAGNGVPVSDSGGQFDEIQRTIFDQHCLSAGCHNAQSLAGNMNLSPGASYDQLVNVAPDNPVASSQGLQRVTPFNPNNSFLLIKVTQPGPGEGSMMPMGMNPLSPSDIDMIRAWIVAGAPRGSTPGPTGSPSPSAPTPTSSASVTATPPATDTATPIATSTLTATREPATPTATATDSGTPPTPTETSPAGTATASTTSTSTSTPSSTPTPTLPPTETPTSTPSPTATSGAFQEIQTTIFNTTCTGAFCHDVQGMSGGLVLVEGQSYGNLVNVEPQNVAAQQAGMLRVIPFNPDNSFLVVKLENPTLAMGSRMPLGKPPLSADQIQLIRNWIAAGAPQ
jgi:hypothetical protein